MYSAGQKRKLRSPCGKPWFCANGPSIFRLTCVTLLVPILLALFIDSSYNRLFADERPAGTLLSLFEMMTPMRYVVLVLGIIVKKSLPLRLHG